MTSPTRPAFVDIAAAARTIAGQVVRTPTLAAPNLSALTGADVRVKYEMLQLAHSFKARGALNRILALSPEERARGVVTMSAGNHAQGVAVHAQRLGISAKVVMPEATPLTKIAATRGYGAEVLFHGETLTESAVKAREIVAAEGRTLIHPYDDPLIVAGQGTVALEMLADQPDLEVLVVPIGGGGLIAGCAIAAKTLAPGIEILGVQAAQYPSMWNLFHSQERPLGGVTLAEGIAVKSPGACTWPIIRDLVDDVLLVEEAHLEQAVNAFLDRQKVIAEGAGAAGLAALLAHPERFRGRKVGLVLCGGNIDSRLLAAVLMRELERSGRLVAVRIEISDRPGVLGRIASCIGEMEGNILAVDHRRLMLDVAAKGAALEIAIEVQDHAHGDRIMAAIQDLGFSCHRIAATGDAL